MSEADKLHKDYVAAVLRGEWPEDRQVPMPSKFADGRGVIQNLMFGDFSSAAMITSARGTVRANHYHKTDWHFSYVVSGRVVYLERPVGASSHPSTREFRRGEMFFTPPNVEHAMVFADETTFLTFAKNVRSHENHEEDVVRVNLVDAALIEALIKR